ncbi:MAG: hypothetical protein M1561_04445 [Gammaproteobacteria bacterium]|nr:hypothetical protein [Gammaproteobacteria bacterium]
MWNENNVRSFIQLLYSRLLHKYNTNVEGFINELIVNMQSHNSTFATSIFEGALYCCEKMLLQPLVDNWLKLFNKSNGKIEIPISFATEVHEALVQSQEFDLWVNASQKINLTKKDIYHLSEEHQIVFDIFNRVLFSEISSNLKLENIPITFIVDDQLLKNKGGITFNTCGGKENTTRILPYTHPLNKFKSRSNSVNVATVCHPFLSCEQYDFNRPGSDCQNLIHHYALHESAHALGLLHYDSNINKLLNNSVYWDISIMGKIDEVGSLSANQCSGECNYLMGLEFKPLDFFLLYIAYNYGSCQHFINHVHVEVMSSKALETTDSENAHILASLAPQPATNVMVDAINTTDNTSNARVSGLSGAPGITGAPFGFEEIQESGATSASSSAWFNWGILYPFFSILRTPSPFMISEKNSEPQRPEEKQEVKQGTVMGRTVEMPYQDTRSVVQSLDGNIGLFAVMTQWAADAWNWWVIPKKPPVVYMEEKAFERNLYRCEHYLRAIKNQLNETYSFINRMRKTYAINVYNFAKQQLAALQDAYYMHQETFEYLQEKRHATTEEMYELLQDLEYLKTNAFIEAREDIEMFIERQKNEVRLQEEMDGFLKRRADTLSLIVGYRPPTVFSAQVTSQLSPLSREHTSSTHVSNRPN